MDKKQIDNMCEWFREFAENLPDDLSLTIRAAVRMRAPDGREVECCFDPEDLVERQNRAEFAKAMARNAKGQLQLVMEREALEAAGHG